MLAFFWKKAKRYALRAIFLYKPTAQGTNVTKTKHILTSDF